MSASAQNPPLVGGRQQQQPQQQQRFVNPAAFQQSLALILNSSIIFKVFCTALLAGYLFTFKENAAQYVTVIPGKLLPPNYYIWSLITHSFVEFRLYELFIDWFIILLYCKMVEPLWGTIECLLFYFIVTMVVAVSTSLLYFVAFALTFKESLLFNISIHGLGGLVGGLSVAVKQVMPDTIIVDLSFLRLKQDNLPLLLIVFSIFVYLIGLTDFTYVVMVSSGVYYGWLYLRFFQRHKNGTRGDSSSTFVFASLFPSQIQPFVAIIANTIFNLLVKLKVCKQPPKRYNVSSLVSGGGSSVGSGASSSHVTISIPLVQTSENSDAERRRLKALKALKERLKKPDEEDEETLKSEWSDASSTNLLLPSQSQSSTVEKMETVNESL